ncbi:PA domain protein [Mycobacterium xenopi 3993]|nr:PA domain protein [Mycobacterium xenopi 3993]
MQGAVVLVDRGTCPFAQKEKAAVERGAVAMVVADNVDEKEMGGTLGENTDVKIPVVSVTKADGAQLRAQPGPATVKLKAETQTFQARNVIAQTKTGSTTDVVMAGRISTASPRGPASTTTARVWPPSWKPLYDLEIRRKSTTPCDSVSGARRNSG